MKTGMPFIVKLYVTMVTVTLNVTSLGHVGSVKFLEYNLKLAAFSGIATPSLYYCLTTRPLLNFWSRDGRVPSVV